MASDLMIYDPYYERALNPKIQAGDRVDVALATIADGIMLACKK